MIFTSDHGDLLGEQIWKYSRYFDNPQFWSNPDAVDGVQPEFGPKLRVWAGIKGSLCVTVPKIRPVPDEFELYNLTADPLEEYNLADPRHMTPQTGVSEREWQHSWRNNAGGILIAYVMVYNLLGSHAQPVRRGQRLESRPLLHHRHGNRPVLRGSSAKRRPGTIWPGLPLRFRYRFR